MKNLAVLDIKQFESGHRIKDFHVDSLESHLITAHKNINKPHKHNFYLTVLFTHGSGKHEVDFVTYHVQPGTLFFLNPGQMHHWELSKDVRGFIFFHSKAFYDLHFTGSRLHDYPFFQGIQNLPVMYLEPKQNLYFSGLFTEVFQESGFDQVFSISKIRALLELIYIQSTRLYLAGETLKTVKRNIYSETFQQFEQLVDTHYKTEKSAAQYAEWLHISPKHLNRITQNMVNKTTTDIILERVFLEAKRELMVQKVSFGAVAEDLGYMDYAYFSRLFKKKCGETPSEFLKRYY